MLSIILFISLSMAQIEANYTACSNNCVDVAEKSGQCFDEQEECDGITFEKCLDDCNYDMAETMENEPYTCTTDTECVNECEARGLCD